MIYALIPAAGKSTRMSGKPKLALPLGGHTVLQRVIFALKRAGVERTLVVVGAHVAELVAHAQSAGAETLLLPIETPDMRATVEAGLRWLEDRYHPQASDGWLLVPGDHPTLDAETVRHLLQAKNDHSERSIIVPAFQGRRGHPTLIDWKHVPELRRWPRDQGLNVYLRGCHAETLEIAVATDTILVDLDTPEDYERLVKLG